MLGRVTESVWNGLMLNTIGTTSNVSHKRVQRLGAWVEVISQHGGIVEKKMTHLFEEDERDASSEELAEVLCGERAKTLEDVLLDSGALCLRVVGIVRDNDGREVSVIDGIVNGDRDFETSLIIDYSSCDTCPHRLDIGGLMRIKLMRRLDRRWVLTVRLAYPGTWGLLAEATLDSLRRTASEGFEVN